MSDWIGLGIIVFVVVGAVVGLSLLGRSPKPISKEEYERRVADGRGWASAGAFAGMTALQKVINPKAVEAIEVQKDLKAGFYNDEEKTGEGDGPESYGEVPEPGNEVPKPTDEEGKDA
jgi:hypothetical protein